MSEFYRRLDEAETSARIARIFANRPGNLHDYQGCANDEARKAVSDPSTEPEAAPTECLCDEYGKDLCAIHNVQPEAASEEQVPAAPECDYSEQAERDAEKLAEGYYSPHRFGDGPAWYAACVAACREIAQLRARVAILDAQEVELPGLDVTECDLGKAIGWMAAACVPSEGTLQAFAEYLACRERQLLDAQRAVQAQRTIMRDLRNGLVAARDFIDSGDSGWFPQQWRDAIAAYDALAGKGE